MNKFFYHCIICNSLLYSNWIGKILSYIFNIKKQSYVFGLYNLDKNVSGVLFIVCPEDKEWCMKHRSEAEAILSTKLNK